MNGNQVLFSADDLCVAAETILRAKVPELTAALGVAEVYGAIKEWKQLPTGDALTASTAALPAVAISSPGLVSAPSFSRRDNAWTATWRLVAGIYVRGANHDDTSAKVRDWCALFRAVLLAHQSLGGIAKSVTWSGEEYGLFPQPQVARTFGAGAVVVDVLVEGIKTQFPMPPATGGPTVSDTSVAVTIKE